MREAKMIKNAEYGRNMAEHISKVERYLQSLVALVGLKVVILQIPYFVNFVVLSLAEIHFGFGSAAILEKYKARIKEVTK